LWDRLGISFVRRAAFDAQARTLGADAVLERTRAEAQRLTKLVPLMGREMGLVADRERAKYDYVARYLATRRVVLEADADAARAALVAVTRRVREAVEEFEAKHGLGFVYRGVAYLDVVRADSKLLLLIE
jgi:hypothetical protein